MKQSDHKELISLDLEIAENRPERYSVLTGVNAAESIQETESLSISRLHLFIIHVFSITQMSQHIILKIEQL